MGLKLRFIIIAILLGLRLYGANSELIKAATAIGMTFTAFSILFTLIRGRDKRPMGGNYTFVGIITAIVGVIIISNFLMRGEGINLHLLPIIFISLVAFALALILMKRHNRFAMYMGGIMGGAAVAVVSLGFLTYLIIGVKNGFMPINEAYHVALSEMPFEIPFVWAR